MAKFHVTDIFEMAERRLVILMGSVVDGEISVGVYARIPVDANHYWSLRVHSIEFARTRRREDLCLCFESEPGLLDALKGLELNDTTIDFADTPSDKWLTLKELKERWKE